MLVQALLLHFLRYFPVRATVIEKGNVVESPRETSKKDPIIVERLLVENPLLRSLSMFSATSKSTSHSNSAQMSEELSILTRSLKTTRVQTSTNRSGGGQLNGTLFNSIAVDGQFETRRRKPNGSVLRSTTLEHLLDESEYKDVPFTVSDSLLDSFTNGFSADGISMRSETASDEQVARSSAGGSIPSATGSVTASYDIVLFNTTTRSTVTTTVRNEMTTFLSSSTSPTLLTTAPSETPSPKRASAAKTKKETKPGLKKSLFQGVLYAPEPESREPTGSTSILSTEVNLNEEQSPIESFVISEEQVVIPREKGGLTVSGTWYYRDNRVEGDVRHKSKAFLDEHRQLPRHSSREQMEMMRDPLFTIEAELTRMNDRTAYGKPAQDGTILRKLEGRTDGNNKQKHVLFDVDPFSTVSMLRRGGRLFERRVTEIGGKTVTVELGNRHLHGVDLIVRPGSVVHGSLPTDEERANVDKARIEKRSDMLYLDKDGNPLSVVANLFSPNFVSMRSFTIEPNDDNVFAQSEIFDSSPQTEVDADDGDECFSARAEVALSGTEPIKRHTARSAIECLTECARQKRCRSVNFSSSLPTCEIFAGSEDPMAMLQHRLGFTFYIRKQMDALHCMNDVLRLTETHRRIISNPKASESRNLKAIKPRLRLTSHRLLSSKAECTKGSGVIFVRTSGVRNDRGTNLDTVFRISEDDCVFSCLTNKAVDERQVLCASAEYESKMQRCTLSSEPRTNALLSHKFTTFYEKLCLSQNVANQCSGATLNRTANLVMVGFMRDTAITSGVDKCIEQCVMAQKDQGFKCLSIMYYHDGTMPNCILNDASSRTNPNSTIVELSSIVDFFELDDCYGLPETVNIRQVTTLIH